MTFSLTFLGTGTSRGVPMLGCNCPTCRSKDTRDQRLRASILVESGATILLIDCGPDLRQQLLRANPSHVDAVLLTHSHADHLHGLDDLQMISNFQHQELPFYAAEQDIKILKTNFPYVEKLKYAPHSFSINQVPEQLSMEFSTMRWSVPQLKFYPWSNDFAPCIIKDLLVQPVPILHGKTLDIGYRIGPMAYLTDCSAIPESSYALLHDLDILIIDGLRPSPPHPTHFCFSEAIEQIQRIKPKRAYLTHLNHDVLHSRDEKTLPLNIFLPYDGLTLTY